jgi:hypothetical protein
MTKKYRQDFHDPAQVITMTQVAIEATDKDVKSTKNFALDINHVNSIDGRGFMSSVRHISRFVCIAQNGYVHVGEDEKAYDKALAEGEKHLVEHQQKLNVTMRTYHEPQPKRKPK